MDKIDVVELLTGLALLALALLIYLTQGKRR